VASALVTGRTSATWRYPKITWSFGADFTKRIAVLCFSARLNDPKKRNKSPRPTRCRARWLCAAPAWPKIGRHPRGRRIASRRKSGSRCAPSVPAIRPRVRRSTIVATPDPLNEILRYAVGDRSSGIGSEQSKLSPRIGLGHPPCALSNPLRLSISFVGDTRCLGERLSGGGGLGRRRRGVCFGWREESRAGARADRHEHHPLLIAGAADN
jgi:hypothetical protein